MPCSRRLAGLILCVSVGVSSCARQAPPPTPYTWRLPPGLPVPRVPPDNPMSDAKVQLGRHLFYDARLSANAMFACATCHQQSRAFTDGRPRAVGSSGGLHARSAMSLANVAYNASYGWADARVTTLEAQMAMPLFNQHPVELGLTGHESTVVARFAADPIVAALFAEAFPGEARPVRMDTIVKALASFERTLISGSSPLDRYLYRDDRAALDASAQRGMKLFFSERFGCADCHGGFNLSGPTVHEAGPAAAPAFHNTALYDIDGRGSYPAIDRGLLDVTSRLGDMGRFRAPTLRNIALTAPYMHDGSVPTLDAVIDHYASGGHASVWRDPRVRGFSLTAAERRDLVQFLEALTDREFVANPAFGPPR